MRFFQTDNIDAYESARLALDSAWSHVPPTTCIEPAASAPRDAAGRIVLAVNDEFCAYPAAAEMLSLMLGSGAAIEISEADYRAATDRPLP